MTRTRIFIYLVSYSMQEISVEQIIAKIHWYYNVTKQKLYKRKTKILNWQMFSFY